MPWAWESNGVRKNGSGREDHQNKAQRAQLGERPKGGEYLERLKSTRRFHLVPTGGASGAVTTSTRLRRWCEETTGKILICVCKSGRLGGARGRPVKQKKSDFQEQNGLRHENGRKRGIPGRKTGGGSAKDGLGVPGLLAQGLQEPQ